MIKLHTKRYRPISLVGMLKRLGRVPGGRSLTKVTEGSDCMVFTELPRVDTKSHFRRPRADTKPHFNDPRANK